MYQNNTNFMIECIYKIGGRMQLIYTVVGESGLYDDYSKWSAKSFFDHGAAEAYLDSLKEVSAQTWRHVLLEQGKTAEEIHSIQKENLPELLKIDPKAKIYFDGVFYSIEESTVE